MSTSKKREEFYVRMLQRIMPNLPQSEPIAGERPDFTIESSEGTIGLEVTRLFKAADSMGRTMQAQESERELVICDAMRLYEASQNPPVEVRVLMVANTHFSKKNRGSFARTLCNLVASNIPPDQNWITIESRFDETQTIPDEILILSIARFGHQENYWSAMGTMWVQTDFAQDIQRALSAKDSQLSKFKNDCVGHWLLIVADGITDSTSFRPARSTLEQAYTSSFQRVFLLEQMAQKAHELRIVGAA